MFDMRGLADAGELALSHDEREALALIARGASPRDVADRLDLDEDSIYRLVGWVLEELQPAPAGRTLADVHADRGTRPATDEEVDEFEQQFGASLPSDEEG